MGGTVAERHNAGSIKYMSPELVEGQNQSDPKIDIWALGILMYAMIIGHCPFGGVTRENIKESILKKEVNFNQQKRVLQQAKKSSSQKQPKHITRLATEQPIDEAIFIEDEEEKKDSVVKQPTKRSLTLLKSQKQEDVPDVSYECLEAIELLLKKDPRERITLFDFLHHPWLQAHQKYRNRKIWNDCYSSSSGEDTSLNKSKDEEDQLDELSPTADSRAEYLGTTIE